VPNAPARSFDLSAIHPQQVRQLAAPDRDVVRPQQSAPDLPAGEPDPRAEVLRLRAALEDVVALAHTNADATRRMIQMQRRAIAALSGLDSRP
jgi:hypothetical protein